MRAPLKSIVIHFVILTGFWIGVTHEPKLQEIPVEITEFLKAKPASVSSGRPPPARAQKAKPASTTKPESSHLPTPSSASESTSPGGTEPGEPVAESYEVAELPRLVNEVRVPYPKIARIRGVQGPVVLDIIVSSKGEVSSAKVVTSPSPELSEAALLALQKFRFRPARLKDKPVAIQIRYTYRFILE